MGVRRVKFLVESVLELRARLQAIDSFLVLSMAAPEHFIPTLITRTQRTAIVYAREIAPEQEIIQDKLKVACNKVNNKNSF
jgi:deoxyribodipyrimidine photolyase